MYVDVNLCIRGNFVGMGLREILIVFLSLWLFIGFDIFNGMNC